MAFEFPTLAKAVPRKEIELESTQKNLPEAFAVGLGLSMWQTR